MRAFEGRTNRATYWTGVATIVVVMVVIGLVSGKPPHVAEVLLIFLGVPRLHDIGKSGWLVLWPVGLEIAGLIVAFGCLPMDSAMAVMGLVVLIIFGLMIWLGCIRGQDIENRFGPPPPRGIGWKKPA